MKNCPAPSRLGALAVAFATLMVPASSRQEPTQDQQPPKFADPVNQALVVSKKAVDAVWAKGFEDGQKKRDIKRALGITERAIDSYHVSMSNREKCSWAYLLHPRLVIYVQGHNAAAQYWPQDKIDSVKKDLAIYGDAEPRIIVFYVVLNEMPSFHAPYGRLSRYADPTNLTDVHCVLKVGDRIIQPLQQPGDLSISKTDGLSFFSIPTTSYVYGSSTSSATAYGSGGYATATGRSYSSYKVTTYNQGSEPYSTYHGEFLVQFSLRDADGKPLIRPQDKEMQLVVVKKTAELTATYRLSDWSKALEK